MVNTVANDGSSIYRADEAQVPPTPGADHVVAVLILEGYGLAERTETFGLAFQALDDAGLNGGTLLTVGVESVKLLAAQVADGAVAVLALHLDLVSEELLVLDDSEWLVAILVGTVDVAVLLDFAFLYFVDLLVGEHLLEDSDADFGGAGGALVVAEESLAGGELAGAQLLQAAGMDLVLALEDGQLGCRDFVATYLALDLLVLGDRFELVHELLVDLALEHGWLGLLEGVLVLFFFHFL